MKTTKKIKEKVTDTATDILVSLATNEGLAKAVSELVVDVAKLKGNVKFLEEENVILNNRIALLENENAVLKNDIALLNAKIEKLEKENAILRRENNMQSRKVELLEKENSSMLTHILKYNISTKGN